MKLLIYPYNWYTLQLEPIYQIKSTIIACSYSKGYVWVIKGQINILVRSKRARENQNIQSNYSFNNVTVGRKGVQDYGLNSPQYLIIAILWTGICLTGRIEISSRPALAHLWHRRCTQPYNVRLLLKLWAKIVNCRQNG